MWKSVVSASFVRILLLTCLLNLGAYGMWFFGLGLVTGLYSVIGLHFYAYISFIAPLLKKRFGTELGLLWCVVGLVLVYNIVYNHFFAMLLKPGSPADLKKIEQM